MTRSIAVAVIAVVVVFVLYQVYQLYRQRAGLHGDIVGAEAKLRLLQEEHQRLNDDVHYFQEPANLSKEFRTRFNYAHEGEKMIIIVPQTSSDD